MLIYFHNYRIHDVDNNTKLDGLEILHALQHTLHENDEEDSIQSDQDWIVGTSKWNSAFRKDIYTYYADSF